MTDTLKAPFPYFGGKSTVAPYVWERLGNCPNYIEPFFGSGAMLLGRPGWREDCGWIETVNDADGMVSNFWRALQARPDEVAFHADWPVNECDMHARHLWLVGRRESLTDRLSAEPDYSDSRSAGWWVWGMSCWIGGGFCSGNGPWRNVDGVLQKTDDGDIERKRPHLMTGGRGVKRQLPHLSGAGQGVKRQRPIYDYMNALADRLRNVRVCCGDWSRITGPSVTVKNGLTAVFLDPPYSTEADRDMNLYAVDCGKVAHDVREWYLANGDDPMLRIALCGYEGEHDMPGWSKHEWKASGGYGGQSADGENDNAKRERVWFSPHCLGEMQGRLL